MLPSMNQIIPEFPSNITACFTDLGNMVNAAGNP